ncbi:MAG: endolytic transglycosylase MltG [Endomicrobium sp.]|jgi:UPF0755 protein|nr:endolytic transglycosylase MltG [Endomicrobium sp.]
MAKRTAYKIIAAIIICVIVFFTIRCFFLSDSNEKKAVTIKYGQGVSSVAAVLKENKLIRSKKLFVVWAKISGCESKIKAGYYEFSKKDGTFKILKALKDGSQSLVKITIPEGSSVKQTADIISRKIAVNREVFINAAAKYEGYLMPETYFISPTLDEEQIIQIMRKEFDDKVTPEMYERAREIDVSMKDVIILASIIEKEAVDPKERAIIAAVFYNRLKKRIRLESCATVLYAMGVNKAKLTLEDTEFDSPYNTYRHFGLPPAPICSPGIESIKAALYPANTGSLFFVSRGNGSHFFAESLDEHIKNRREAKKIQRQKNKEAK